MMLAGTHRKFAHIERVCEVLVMTGEANPKNKPRHSFEGLPCPECHVAIPPHDEYFSE
jgi:hypothetical protein